MANTAKAQAIFKGMTPEQQQAFLNKQKTASAGDQAKVSAALKPIKPVVSTPAGTTPGAPTSTVPPSNTPPISTPPVEPVQDNTVGPADPVTPQIDKAKVAWAKMNADQQQEFASKHNFDPKKYGLEFAKGSTKPQQPTGQNNQTTPPQSTTPEAPAPVVSTQPNYQDNSTARLQEIRNNLDQQLQAAPSLFDDRPAFDATFNYALRSKEQQAVLNNFWYQKSQSDLFNNTPTDVLANSIASNQTSIDAFSFMKDKDPVKYAALQAAVTEANKREALKASLDPKKFLEDFNKRYDESIARIDEQQALINTEELLPAITKSKEELAGLKSEIDQIELDKAKIEAEVLAEYEGKGISKGLLNEIINDRQQTLIDQGNSKILQYNSKLGGLNAKMDEMKMYNDLDKERRAAEMSYLDRTMSTMQTLLGIQQSMDTFDLQQQKLNFDMQKSADKAIEPLIQDFGTTKAPQWKQSFDNGKTRQVIEGVSSGGGTSGKGTSGPSGTPNNLGKTVTNELLTRINRLKAAVYGSPLGGAALLTPNNQADLNYLKNNLTLEKFIETKKQGATYGSMTEGEWKLLGESVTSLSSLMSKDALTRELNRIGTNLGGAMGSTSGSTTTIPGSTTTKPNILGGDPTKSRLKK